jgi:hypothetical protein
MSILKGAHLTVGWLALGIFALSGVYLRVKAPSVYLGDELSHMMFIANHIYILMAGIANVAIGRYITPLENKLGKQLQTLGMGLMMAGSVVLIYAFTLEPMLGSMDRPRTHIGIFLLAGGMVAHMLSGMPEEKKGKKKKSGDSH